MLADVLERDPVLLRFQHLGDEVEQRRRELQAFRRCVAKRVTLQGIVDTFDVLHDLDLSLALEGRSAGHHHVQNHAQRPDIASLIIRKREDLGRHVVAGANQPSFFLRLHLFPHVLLPPEGQPEVYHPYLPGSLILHHEVF